MAATRSDLLKELGKLWEYIDGLPFDARTVGEMRLYVVGDFKFRDPVLNEAEQLRAAREAPFE